MKAARHEGRPHLLCPGCGWIVEVQAPFPVDPEKREAAIVALREGNWISDADAARLRARE